MNPIRAVLIALLTITAAISVSHFTTPADASGSTRVRTRESAHVARTPYRSTRSGLGSLDGFNETVGAMETQWYAGLAANEAARVAAERERDAAISRKIAARARESSPVVTTSPPRATTPSGERCQYADLIRSIWSRDAEWAIGIAWRESNCTEGATNSSHANGVFQMLGHHDIFVAIGCEDEFNAECNVRAAWSLYQGSGRTPWNL